MVRQQHPVRLHEVEQVRHLLQIRRHVRVVTREMDVVELDVDHMLDLPLRRIQHTPRRNRPTLSASSGGRPHRRRNTTHQQRKHKHNPSRMKHLPTSLLTTAARNRPMIARPHPTTHVQPVTARSISGYQRSAPTPPHEARRVPVPRAAVTVADRPAYRQVPALKHCPLSYRTRAGGDSDHTQVHRPWRAAPIDDGTPLFFSLPSTGSPRPPPSFRPCRAAPTRRRHGPLVFPVGPLTHRPSTSRPGSGPGGPPPIDDGTVCLFFLVW